MIHPKKYAHELSFVMFCYGFVLVDFTHILQDHFTSTGAIIRLPQCQWSNPEGYGWINLMNLQCAGNVITAKQITTKMCAHFMGHTAYITQYIYIYITIKVRRGIQFCKQFFKHISNRLQLNLLQFSYIEKNKYWQFDNSVTGGTVSGHNDNLWCHQWWHSCQIDDQLSNWWSIFFFSVLALRMLQNFCMPQSKLLVTCLRFHFKCIVIIWSRLKWYFHQL